MYVNIYMCIKCINIDLFTSVNVHIYTIQAMFGSQRSMLVSALFGLSRANSE